MLKKVSVFLVCILFLFSSYGLAQEPGSNITSGMELTPTGSPSVVTTPESETVAPGLDEPSTKEGTTKEGAEYAGQTGESTDHHGGHGHADFGKELPLWSTIPFVGILLSIALFPLLAPRFWHHHFPKVSAFWAFAFALPFLAAYSDNAGLSILGLLLPIAPFILLFTLKEKQGKIGAMVALVISTVVCMSILHAVGGNAWYQILHIYIIDYIPFIILLWALYTIAGGMVVTGSLRGSPFVNLIMLLIGTLLASWVGTTGAAMLLIRPLIRANKWRTNKVHIIVFFIFLVANVGGALTPLGDPPLFLGFLHGVSFFWTIKLLPQMVFVSVVLLALFFIMDTIYYRKETEEPPEDGEQAPLRVKGLYNFIFLGGVVGSVLMSGSYNLGESVILGVHQTIQNLLRDALLVTMGILSLAITPTALRKQNEFTWAPIQEVAYLFAGIFMTIIPALAILKAGSDGAMADLVNAVNSPIRYFWATGILSSFLDNAPTYLTFFNSALGNCYGHLFAGINESVVVPYLMGQAGDVVNGVTLISDCSSSSASPCGGFKYLAAISAGAVFMGANTYIGNAPNFMVKSIAEESGIPMPSFFGYMLKYSLPILIPLYVAVSLIFY